jgi:hypothetical protein
MDIFNIIYIMRIIGYDKHDPMLTCTAALSGGIPLGTFGL